MIVRPMTVADLAIVLDWARAEGWNPGEDDAAAFHAADPEGFLIGEVGGAPAAAISVVRHDAGTGFLGLYICPPAMRGHGYGLRIWRAGLARLAGRAVGLDGVPAQQSNYRRSGFVAAHRNIRFSGAVPPAACDAARPLAPADLAAAAALDRRATGYDRAAFLRVWLAPAPSRRARGLWRDGALAGFGVVRRCVEGWKVGPLIAQDRADAEALLAALSADAGGATLVLDAPEPNAAAMAMARDAGMTAAFETARMWLGPAPAQDLSRTFGVGTLELG